MIILRSCNLEMRLFNQTTLFIFLSLFVTVVGTSFFFKFCYCSYSNKMFFFFSIGSGLLRLKESNHGTSRRQRWHRSLRMMENEGCN